MKTFRSAEQGFSLIEVLVALLILAIGLLGLAGMQTRSVQMNHSAHQSSQANYLAYDMLDRMRANRPSALNGDYDLEMGAAAPSGTSVAAQDVRDWLQTMTGMAVEGANVPGVLAQAPGTGGSIEVDSDGLVTIMVTWFDARWSDDPEEQLRTVELQARL
ncbi:MAG: type IV pilus modification protein PilV [Alcanivorax sp.]|nr:type IV pilus modification protein PilV [Alcanivorax sp.]